MWIVTPFVVPTTLVTVVPITVLPTRLAPFARAIQPRLEVADEILPVAFVVRDAVLNGPGDAALVVRGHLLARPPVSRVE